MDLLPNGGYVDGTIGMDSDNFLVKLKVNGVSCYIVTLETCRNCDVSCLFLFIEAKVCLFFFFNLIPKILTCYQLVLVGNTGAHSRDQRGHTEDNFKKMLKGNYHQSLHNTM